MDKKFITIQGARSHNLKNLSVNIKKNAITCLMGPSGSGKSSLAVDTLYLESKRRFINSLSTAQKFFWDLPQTCDVDRIEPVLPTWFLPQANPLASSRTNVSDLLGVTTELAKVFASHGHFFCQEHKADFQSEDLEYVLEGFFKKNLKVGVLHFLARKDCFTGKGMMFSRSYDEEKHAMREFCEEDDFVELLRTKKNSVTEILLKLKEFSLKEFWVYAQTMDDLALLKPGMGQVCPAGDRIPHLGSFHHYNPLLAFGACSECRGMGDKLEYDRRKVIPNKTKSLDEGACSLLLFKRFKKYEEHFIIFCKEHNIAIDKPFVDIETDKLWELVEKGDKGFIGLSKVYAILEKKKYKKPYRIFSRKFKSEFECLSCCGTRISKQLFSAYIYIGKQRIFYDKLLCLSLGEALTLFSKFDSEDVVVELLKKRLEVAVRMGLSHLQLKSVGKSLLNSEYQRLLLVKYFSYEGSGSLFILDEPSVGLTIDEQQVLHSFLEELKTKKNTILLIEHSPYLQQKSDEVIVMGPEAGMRGGEILYQGPWKEDRAKFKKLSIFAKQTGKPKIVIEGAIFHTLTKKYFELPLNALVYVSGNSSTGKSIFFNNVLANELFLKYRGYLLSYNRYQIDKFSCSLNFKNIVVFSFESKSYTSRSTIGTLLGLTPLVRKKYAALREAKNMNLKDGHFSPNTEQGKCQNCDGKGLQVVEMDILEDVSFTCPDCLGKKVRPLYADISDGEQSFFEAISTSMENILDRISLTPKFNRIYDYIKKLRLEYLSLDRSFNSLSGGEKQRVLLLIEVLNNRSDVFYLFENLSAGLARSDMFYVARFLQELVQERNTVVILDENNFWKEVAQFSLEYKL